jgi:hypothetical protein
MQVEVRYFKHVVERINDNLTVYIKIVECKNFADNRWDRIGIGIVDCFAVVDINGTELDGVFDDIDNTAQVFNCHCGGVACKVDEAGIFSIGINKLINCHLI